VVDVDVVDDDRVEDERHSLRRGPIVDRVGPEHSLPLLRLQESLNALRSPLLDELRRADLGLGAVIKPHQMLATSKLPNQDHP
jgi:hypothetical protein